MCPHSMLLFFKKWRIFAANSFTLIKRNLSFLEKGKIKQLTPTDLVGIGKHTLLKYTGSSD